VMGYVPRKYDAGIIEALALAGALAPDLSDAEKVAALTASSEWLGRGDPEGQWTAQRGEEGTYVVRRLWRGVTDHHVIEASFLASAEARKLAKIAGEQADVYAMPSRLTRASAASETPEPVATDAGDEDAAEPAATRPVASEGIITRPTQLLDAVLASGRKGLSISRYKGLGEMNAEQLWETTLDPDNRILLQVKVEDADVTDEIFPRLMGDIVEPRRDFIQENALNVANLDV